MIGKLKGVIDSFGEDHVILDVHGVGYVVLCSAKTLTSLPAAGEAAVLSIETQVREDAIRLFGFKQRRGARVVPPAADGAGRRLQGGAGHPLGARSRRSRHRHRHAGQGDDRPLSRASARSWPRASWRS